MVKIHILMLLILVSTSCSSKGQNKERSNPKTFVYATYCASYTMKDSSYVTGMDFSQFDFYYLMSYPKWKNEDFDKPLDSVLKKYVTDYTYPSSGSGYGLTTLFIDSVHRAGNKVLLSLQGNLLEIANNVQRRAKFVKMIAQFVRKFNYDGFDLDWEDAIDLQYHYLFIKELRAEFNKDKERYLYITTAIAPSKVYSAELADSLSREIDWINIMTYDMGGGVWDKFATYNTPMGRIEQRLKNWDVFAPSKLCIGLAAYGFQYNNIKPGERIKYNTKMSDYGKYISYMTFTDSLKNGWIERWNEKEQVSYYFSPDGENFITIDNSQSIDYKIKWAISQGYRGLFWWELYHDYQLPTSHNGRGKLLLKGAFKDSVEKVLLDK